MYARKLIVASIIFMLVLGACAPAAQTAGEARSTVVSEMVEGTLTAMPPTAQPTMTGQPAATLQPTQMTLSAGTIATVVTVGPLPVATWTPRPNQVAEGEADIRTSVESFNANGWSVQTYDGVTDQITQWGRDLKKPVQGWSNTPNMDFPEHGFKAADGMYVHAGDNHYCQQDQRCDLNVPAQHIRIVTGDYDFPGIGSCRKVQPTDPGCAAVFVNGGLVTAMFRNQSIDYGWTMAGPCFNGDAMATTLWAVTSNILYTMTTTNAGPSNLGANCSVPGGCPSVHYMVVITSGNQILMIAETTVYR